MSTRATWTWWRWWLGAAALCLAGAPAAAGLLCPGAVRADALSGCGLALANGAAGFLITRRAARSGPVLFFVWAGAGNLLRLAGFVAMLLTRRDADPEGFAAFGISAVTGSLCFLWAEVLAMHAGAASGTGSAGS